MYDLLSLWLASRHCRLQHRIVDCTVKTHTTQHGMHDSNNQQRRGIARVSESDMNIILSEQRISLGLKGMGVPWGAPRDISVPQSLYIPAIGWV